MKYLFLTASLLLAFASCKKKEFPQNTAEEPTFYLNATIDGNPFSVKAGMAGYYMYSYFSQDSNNLYSFIAEVKPNNCSGTCNNSLKIEINDDQLSLPNGPSNITNSVKVGDYAFMQPAVNFTPTLIGYSVKFKSIFNKTATAYDWNFGDGSPHSTEADPTHTFTSAGIFNACVNIHDGLSFSSMCNPVKVTTSPLACQTRISALVSANTVTFTNHTAGGTGPYTYHWQFGDPANSTSPDPTAVFTYSPPGMYTATLKVKDANNDSTSYSYNINTGQSYKSAPNYSITSINALYTTSVANLFSKIKITYTDSKGVSYVSNLQPQTTSTSNFQIVSVEDYKMNERSEATKKIKITFNCKLYNGSTAVNLQNGEAVLAVSYK